MSPRRLTAIALLGALILALALWQHRARRAPAPADSKIENPESKIQPAATAPSAFPESKIDSPKSKISGSAGLFPDHVSIALDLNSPRFDLTHDLRLLNDLFTDWRLTFPGVGHPFGENAEITAALAGQNSLGIRLFPPDHPAINAAGELCDRWGTPFRFHALAADRMEVQSAGPDRKFATPDDGLITPPPPPGGEPLR